MLNQYISKISIYNFRKISIRETKSILDIYSSYPFTIIVLKIKKRKAKKVLIIMWSLIILLIYHCLWITNRHPFHQFISLNKRYITKIALSFTIEVFYLFSFSTWVKYKLIFEVCEADHGSIMFTCIRIVARRRIYNIER